MTFSPDLEMTPERTALTDAIFNARVDTNLKRLPKGLELPGLVIDQGDGGVDISWSNEPMSTEDYEHKIQREIHATRDERDGGIIHVRATFINSEMFEGLPCAPPYTLEKVKTFETGSRQNTLSRISIMFALHELNRLAKRAKEA